MKNLILFIAIMLCSMVTVSAQSSFIGMANGKSEIVVQDMTTGVEYSFKASKQIFVNIENGHDYFIAVTSKKDLKHFIIKNTDLGSLDDAYFDMASCPGVNVITANPYEEYYPVEEKIILHLADVIIPRLVNEYKEEDGE